MEKYSSVFEDRLGCLRNHVIELRLKPNSKPVFMKSRPVAFALKDKIDKELDKLVTVGVIEPVTYSDYASPIVPVLKSNGSVRICADYSQTINKQLEVEKYPLPTVQELFTKLHGGEQYTKLDMSSAYNQLSLNDDKNITCNNTHKGLFKFKRLIFGLASAPAIFQKEMEKIFCMEGVLCFLDDVLITANDRQTHMSRLKLVLDKFKDLGLTLRKEKCEFFKDEITYLGYIINKQGIKKCPKKVEAIINAQKPNNVAELQSFLGLVNYYRHFVPSASSLLTPLYDLLRKDVKWSWQEEHETVFKKIKQCLASEQVLAHFNPGAKIILTVDASPYGLGAILSQVGEDGIEKPISFASRTLISSEKKYS